MNDRVNVQVVNVDDITTIYAAILNTFSTELDKLECTEAEQLFAKTIKDILRALDKSCY